MDQATYLAAKKLFETYDLRVADNSLSVDAAYDIKVSKDVRDLIIICSELGAV